MVSMITIATLLWTLVPCAALVGGPYPRGVYDASAARAYFGRRPLVVASRAAEIAVRSAGFAATLLGDALAGAELDGDRADARGRALTDLLVELGQCHVLFFICLPWCVGRVGNISAWHRL